MCHTNIFKGQLFNYFFNCWVLILSIFSGFQCLFSGLYSDKFGELITFYLDSDKNTVIAELYLWHVLLEKNEQRPKYGLEALRLSKNEIFPNIIVY